MYNHSDEKISILWGCRIRCSLWNSMTLLWSFRVIWLTNLVHYYCSLGLYMCESNKPGLHNFNHPTEPQCEATTLFLYWLCLLALPLAAEIFYNHSSLPPKLMRGALSKAKAKFFVMISCTALHFLLYTQWSHWTSYCISIIKKQLHYFGIVDPRYCQATCCPCSICIAPQYASGDRALLKEILGEMVLHW
jgi:hypothetical protein